MKEKSMILTLIPVLLVAAGIAPCIGQERAKEELRPALIVMDVQNKWMPMMAEEDRLSAPDKINELIALFREYDYPVIRVYHCDPKHGPEPDTEPFEFPASINVTDEDRKIIKSYPSAFTKTDLEKDLRAGGNNTIFLCGLSATGCVLATYFGATDREMPAVMVEGALLSHDASYTKVIEDICYSMTIEEIREAFERP
jgi:nicotinamidase-related amidase